jgi:putative transposase
MKFNPEFHHRRSIRLKGYDYSRSGAYFVTICSWNRECNFGKIVGMKPGKPEMILNDFGKIVRDEWVRTSLIRKEIEIDDFIVMPNHFHGIVFIRGRGDRLVAPKAMNTCDIQGDRPVAPCILLFRNILSN